MPFNSGELDGDKMRIDHVLEQFEAHEWENYQLLKNNLAQKEEVIAGLRKVIGIQDAIISSQARVISRKSGPESEEARAQRLAIERFEEEARTLDQQPFGLIPKSATPN